MNYVAEYIQKIKSGEIIVCEKVKKLYLGIIEPIIDGKSEKYYFSEKKGEKFILFVEAFCRQSKGRWAGQNLKLCLFQKAKWQCIFGILRRDDRKRRFTEIFDVRGRKNGKTTEESGLGLYLLLEEKGAEIYASATTRTQAMIVWELAQSMVDQDYELQKIFKYKVFPQPMIYTKKNVSPIASSFKVLSKNVKTFDGLNASGAIIDEVHELPRQIYDILKQSMSTRENPILSMISSAGFVRSQLFDNEYDYASKILDGTIDDDTLFPLIYEMDSKDEIRDEAMWIKANPGIDVIKSREILRNNVKRAMSGDLDFANTVLTKDFNVIGVENKAWLTAESIINASFGLFDPKEIGEAGTDAQEHFIERYNNQIALIGYDLSSSFDMTSVVVLLFDQEKETIIVRPMFWVTKDYIDSDEAKQSRVPYRSWIQRGLVRMSGDHRIDYKDMGKYIAEELIRKYGYAYQFIGYDPWNSAQLVSQLDDYGFSREYVQKEVRQGFKTLGEPMKELQARLLDRRICYLNNPVFKWQLSNAELVQDSQGNTMIKKVNDSRTRKIDGVAACLNALALYCQSPSSYLHESTSGAISDDDGY